MRRRSLLQLCVFMVVAASPCLAEEPHNAKPENIFDSPAVTAFRLEANIKSRPLLGGLGPSNGPLGYITEFYVTEGNPPLFSIGGDVESSFKNNTAYIVPTPIAHKWLGGVAYKVCTAPSTLFGTCYDCEECGTKKAGWQKYSLPIMDDPN